MFRRLERNLKILRSRHVESHLLSCLASVLSLEMAPSSNVKQCNRAGGKMNSDIISQEEAGRHHVCASFACLREVTHGPLPGGKKVRGSGSDCKEATENVAVCRQHLMLI